MQCLKCPNQLPPPTGSKGRPQRYCSVACRRLAEGEIRRITRQLDTHSDRLLDLAPLRAKKDGLRDWHGRTHEQQYEDTKQTITALEDRLRVLLADDDPEPREQ